MAAFRRNSWPMKTNEAESSSSSSGDFLQPIKEEDEDAIIKEATKNFKPEATACGAMAAVGAAAAGAGGGALASAIRKRRIASIFQHYYPEGDWGYVILFCASVSHFLSHGLQLSFGVLALLAQRRFFGLDLVQFGKYILLLKIGSCPSYQITREEVINCLSAQY